MQLPLKMPPNTTVSPSAHAPNPFIHGLIPNEGESPEDKARREGKEAEAAAVSNAIDEQLQQEKVATVERYQNTVKVLLLGESESGQWANIPCHAHSQSLADARAQESQRLWRVRSP